MCVLSRTRWSQANQKGGTRGPDINRADYGMQCLGTYAPSLVSQNRLQDIWGGGANVQPENIDMKCKGYGIVT